MAATVVLPAYGLGMGAAAIFRRAAYAVKVAPAGSSSRIPTAPRATDFHPGRIEVIGLDMNTVVRAQLPDDILQLSAEVLDLVVFDVRVVRGIGIPVGVQAVVDNDPRNPGEVVFDQLISLRFVIAEEARHQEHIGHRIEPLVLASTIHLACTMGGSRIPKAQLLQAACERVVTAEMAENAGDVFNALKPLFDNLIGELERADALDAP